MKKLIINAVVWTIVTMSIMFAVSAEAHWRGGYGYRGGWVAPLVIGGVIGYELSQPRYYVPPPQPVYVKPPVAYTQPVYVEPPVGYHWEQILDANCGCYKTVLVSNY
jgi:hypothetical protein